MSEATKNEYLLAVEEGDRIREERSANLRRQRSALAAHAIELASEAGLREGLQVAILSSEGVSWFRAFIDSFALTYNDDGDLVLGLIVCKIKANGDPYVRTERGVFRNWQKIESDS